MSGKVLTMYLMDGDPIGRIKCKIANWTGIVYKIPRISIDNCDDIQELTQSGVYLLFGTDKDENTVVYIGQAGNRKNGRGLLQRICEPHNSIDYWSEVIILTTGDGSFGPTEISYLENRLFNMARKAGRCDVKNSNDPNPGNVTEEKECELEEFINYARIAVGAIGHRVFEPIALPAESRNSEPILHMEYKGAIAKGQCTSEGFVVFKGSSVNPETTKKCPSHVTKNRKKYADMINEENKLTADVFFDSPSAAAGFVGGTSLNGKIKWIDDDGRALKEIM